MRAAGLLGLMLSGCAIAGRYAGDRDLPPPVLFQESSTVGFSVSDQFSHSSGEVFEARPALHFYLYDGLQNDDIWRRGGWGMTVSGTFLSTARMLRDESAPVRVPSYNPRIKVQEIHLQRIGGGKNPDALLLGMQFHLGHYSNGQDGCGYAGHTRNPNPAQADGDFGPLSCPGAGTDLNLVNGSFSLDYLRLDIVSAYWTKVSSDDERGLRTPAWDFSATAGVQWNGLPGPGSMDPVLEDRYGLWAIPVELQVEHFTCVEKQHSVRMTLATVLHLPRQSEVWGSAELTLAYIFKRLGVGGFVRGRVGRDELNMRFEQTRNDLTVGLLLDPNTVPDLKPVLH